MSLENLSDLNRVKENLSLVMEYYKLMSDQLDNIKNEVKDSWESKQYWDINCRLSSYISLSQCLKDVPFAGWFYQGRKPHQLCFSREGIDCNFRKKRMWQKHIAVFAFVPGITNIWSHLLSRQRHLDFLSNRFGVFSLVWSGDGLPTLQPSLRMQCNRKHRTAFAYGGRSQREGAETSGGGTE